MISRSTLAFCFIPIGNKLKTCSHNRRVFVARWHLFLLFPFFFSLKQQFTFNSKDLKILCFYQTSPHKIGVEAAQTLFRNGTTILLFNISWLRTFTCVWYFNFMIYISLMSFLLDKYISSLIFVYLENACQVYILLLPCLPYYFFGIQCRIEITPSLHSRHIIISNPSLPFQL